MNHPADLDSATTRRSAGGHEQAQTYGRAHRSGPGRPSPAHWQDALDRLAHFADTAGQPPAQLLRREADRLGVQPRTMRARFDEAVRRQVWAVATPLGSADIDAVAACRDFAAAIEVLRRRGITTPGPVLARAFRAHHGRALTGLVVRQDRQRSH